MRIALAVPLVIKARKLVLDTSGLVNWNSCVTPYLYFDTDEARFKFLQKLSGGFSPMAQRESFQEDVGRA